MSTSSFQKDMDMPEALMIGIFSMLRYFNIPLHSTKSSILTAVGNTDKLALEACNEGSVVQ